MKKFAILITLLAVFLSGCHLSNLILSKKMLEKYSDDQNYVTLTGVVIELKELLYMEFRRYLYRRKANVTAQSILLAIGYNINKLHHKIQAGRTGRLLFPLKQTAWFWQVKSKSWKRTFFQKRFIKVRLLVETEWKERIFRLKNGKKMLPHLWFPNHWCDSPDY